MRIILLTRGQFTVVEEQDFEGFGHLNWYASQGTSPGVFYAARREEGKIVLLHRLIRRALPDELVDHENGNTLDNRRSNLRLATHSQNCQNQRKGSRPMSSKFKGVCRVSAVVNATNPWLAYIGGVRGPTKRKYLGYFPTEFLAASAYNQAAAEMFGEFACLNNV